jgi:hypothetical protein
MRSIGAPPVVAPKGGKSAGQAQRRLLIKRCTPCISTPAWAWRSHCTTEGYDLSLNRYKEQVHDEVEHRPPLEILAELRSIEQEILQGIE